MELSWLIFVFGVDFVFWWLFELFWFFFDFCEYLVFWLEELYLFIFGFGEVFWFWLWELVWFIFGFGVDLIFLWMLLFLLEKMVFWFFVDS